MRLQHIYTYDRESYMFFLFCMYVQMQEFQNPHARSHQQASAGGSTGKEPSTGKCRGFNRQKQGFHMQGSINRQVQGVPHARSHQQASAVSSTCKEPSTGKCREFHMQGAINRQVQWVPHARSHNRQVQWVPHARSHQQANAGGFQMQGTFNRQNQIGSQNTRYLVNLKVWLRT